MRRRLLASALLAAVAAPLAAQPPASPPMGYDQPPPGPDGQGGQGGGYGRRGFGRPLTRDAALASVSQGFAALDANHDGVVTRDEVDAYRAARRAAMRARREGGDMPSGEPGMPPAGGTGRGGVGPLLNNPGWFNLADSHHDGRVTPTEAQAGAAALFDRMDLNHDGTVDPDERRQAMMGMRRNNRADGDGAPPAPPQPQ